MKTFKTVILLTLMMSLFACSDDKDEPKKQTSGDHIWKSQTDTIQTTKDAAKKLQDSLDQQQQKLDETN